MKLPILIICRPGLDMRFVFAAIWAIVFPIFVVSCNFLAPKAKISSDFLVSFYIAGRMILDGHAALIYPSLTSTGWNDAPINIFAHSFQPGLPSNLISNFMYSPAVAVIVAPFASLEPAWALAAWQLFSLLLLLLTALIMSHYITAAATAAKAVTEIAQNTSNARISTANTLRISVFALLFTPICANLWVGQTAIIFGTLPVVAYILLARQKHFFAAACALSVLGLKPQYLFFALALCIFSPELKKTWSGLLTGLFIIFLSSCILSWNVFLAWIHSLTLSEHFLGSQNYSMASYLAASLPSALLLSLPQGLRSSWHILIYAMGTLLALAFIAAIRIFVTSKLANRSESTSLQMTIALLAACMVEELAAPRLVLYDISLFLPALMLLWFEHGSNRQIRLLVICTFLSVNCYTLLCMCTAPSPLLMVLILIASNLIGIELLRKPNSQNPSPRSRGSSAFGE